MAGICFRTPFGPGAVRFNGFPDSVLAYFAVIPESDTTLITPENDVWYDADGFWYRYHSPSTEWYKVGNHCDCEVHFVAPYGFRTTYCCNEVASWIKGTPGYSGTGHATSNPF